MIIDLTTQVPSDSPLITWAKTQDNKHIAMGHVGTHLDVYEKSVIPIEYFKSQGIVFDVRGKQEVSLRDVDLAKVPSDGFVIFRTGQMGLHNYGDKGYFKDHPYLSTQLIDALIEKKVRFIGVDCPGIRQHEEHEQADRLCERNGIYVIENLQNVGTISSSPCVVYTMWLDDEIMTGLKCRVIVEQV